MPSLPPFRRALHYAVPSAAIAACMGLAILCLLGALAELERPFPGFLVYKDGAITSLMRRHWQGPRAGLRPRDVIREIDHQPVHDGPTVARALARTEPGAL